MDGTGDLFAPFAEIARAQFDLQVVRYPTLEALNYAALIELVSSRLPSNRDFVLLGESFSGPIAVEIAAQHRERLRALVLCCTFVTNPLPLLSPLKRFVRLMPIKHLPHRVLTLALSGTTKKTAVNDLLSAALAKVDVHALRARMQAAFDVDCRKTLASLSVPIVYLRATRDRVVRHRIADALREIQPKMEIIDIDAPHFLLQSEPSVATSAIHTFLARNINDTTNSNR
jgi:pimeloyl-[acyl-carrier protein] methyl ester esterase